MAYFSVQMAKWLILANIGKPPSDLCSYDWPAVWTPGGKSYCRDVSKSDAGHNRAAGRCQAWVKTPKARAGMATGLQIGERLTRLQGTFSGAATHRRREPLAGGQHATQDHGSVDRDFHHRSRCNRGEAGREGSLGARAGFAVEANRGF